MKKFTNDQKNANWNEIFVFTHHLWQNKTQDWLYPSLIRIWGERCIIHCWWEQTPVKHLEWKFSNTEGPQLLRVWLKIFWLYNGSNAISIQQKLYFKFWTLVISWASNMWYDTLSWCWAAVAASCSSQSDIRSRGQTTNTQQCIRCVRWLAQL